ncbi:MAG: GNAT family N-acetyltransferase [Pseudomonadota bacterium]|jgi:GNAT superfamily N-acetyltransferase|uniref:Acetyltransferase, GNAT family n=1 Tax=hydrothermal vent metagenome TaxID=652676 RepID=A0A170PN98_9ZZZZ
MSPIPLPSDGLRIETFSGSTNEALALLLPLCGVVFATFDPEYLASRLPHVADPHLLLARRGDDTPMGFKLGYRRGGGLFYSWLGGVAPEARRIGLAARLMERQHEEIRALGYHHVETRTRAENNSMILLNLRHGFHVTGFEIDARGAAVVTQRKILAE